jgi:hypothetical protein
LDTTVIFEPFPSGRTAADEQCRCSSFFLIRIVTGGRFAEQVDVIVFLLAGVAFARLTLGVPALAIPAIAGRVLLRGLRG